MIGFLQLTWIEMKLFIREWQAVFFTFIFLPSLMLLFGLIAPRGELDIGGFGNLDLMIPKFIAIGIAANGFFTIGGVVTSYREKGILRRFQVTPLSPVGVLAAQILVAYIMSLFSALLLIAIGLIAFNLKLTQDLPSLIAAFTIGSISFFSFGFLLGGLFKTTRISYSVNTTLFFPMIFLSGAALPVALPDMLRTVSSIIPLTYIVDLMQDAWIGIGIFTNWLNIVVLGVFFVVCVILSFLTFRWD